MSSQPVWTWRPLLSDVELVLLRLFGNRVLRSDLSQLWAAHLTFIPSPSFTPAITPLLHLLKYSRSTELCHLIRHTQAHGFLRFTRLGGKARTHPASTWRDLAVVASILAFRFLRIGISVNSFQTCCLQTYSTCSSFSSRVSFLDILPTSSLIFVVEMAVRKNMCEIPPPPLSQSTDFLFICRQTQFFFAGPWKITASSEFQIFLAALKIQKSKPESAWGWIFNQIMEFIYLDSYSWKKAGLKKHLILNSSSRTADQN